MTIKVIDWQALSNSRKVEIMTQVKDYLNQQVSEAKFCRAIADTYNIKA